ncbi:MAG: YdeI/OmpD-associated family protein [Planctomycetia bacterium]|nr:YdeI/OmpD-associated family protein [Planctomycetia bacterium]
MGKKDPRVDAYIAKSADYAKGVLMHLRRIVHSACPQVEEAIKWGHPSFLYKGILCGMAAFKAHCTFGFWHKSMRDATAGKDGGETAMGQFGRITRLTDLPKEAEIARLVKRAKRLHDDGVKAPAAPKPKRRQPLRIPADLSAALRRNKKAQKTFDDFSYTNRKEYVEWIVEAKRAEAREKRLATAIEWMADGKSRNWKYERK